ncbi:MAG: putative membrane protein [Actinomycetes bacterium]|jgi:putative membrane protein
MGIRSTPKENTGSRARDHLANERTYLAWIRTGLAVVTIGIVIGEILPPGDRLPVHLPLLLLGLGVALMAYSLATYYVRLKNLDLGLFGSDRAGPILLSVMLGIVALTGILLIFDGI